MDKPKMVRIPDGDQGEALVAAQGELNAPAIITDDNGRMWLNADEMRLWRSARTSTVKHET